MFSDALFPNISLFNKAGSPTSVQELLAQVSMLALAVQTQFAASPRFTAEPVEENAQESCFSADEIGALLPDWHELVQKWWVEQEQPHRDLSTLRMHIYPLMELEVAILAMVEPAIKHRIEALFAVGVDNAMGQVMVQAGDYSGRLPGCFVVTRDLERATEGDEDFMLYGLGWGAWFDDQPASAARRLEQVLNSDQPWTKMLPQALRQAISEGAQLALSFDEAAYPPSRQLVRDLKTLQDSLLAELQARAEEEPISAGMLNAATRLDGWVGGLKERIADHLAAYRLASRPRWLRRLNGEALETYLTLQASRDQASRRITEHLGHLGDYRSFAEQGIRNWLDEHANGLRISPSKTRLSVRSLFPDARGERECSLLDWVLTGGYRGYNLFTEAVEPALRDTLTHGLMQRMINGLELHLGYREQASAMYQQPDTQELLGGLVTAELAFSALAARYANEIPEHVHAFITALLEGEQAAEGIELKQVQLRRQPLLGVVCLVEDDAFTLYAPGAPFGALRRFATELDLQRALVDMVGTPVGMAYVLGHSELDVREFQQVAIGRGRLPLGAFRLAPLREGFLAKMLDDMTTGLLDNVLEATPQWSIDASPEDRERLASLDNELLAVQPAYLASNQMPTLLGFAQQRATARLNEFPGNKGGWIDADTVILETPEGELTFTQLMAWGYPSDSNFAGFTSVRSSVGQDLSHLDIRLLASAIRVSSGSIRGSYVSLIESHSASDESPEHARRLRLHGLVMGLKVRRDFLVASLDGRLDESRTSWLREIALTPSQDDVLEHHNFRRFAFNRGELRFIDGVYAVDAPDDERFVYLSDAQGGRAVRSFREIAAQWTRENLGAYFLPRVIHSDKAAMRAMDEDREKNGERVVLNTYAYSPPRLVHWDEDFERRALHLILDAKSQTTSVFERYIETLDLVLSPVVSALTMPFPPITAVVSLIRAQRSFHKAATAWWNGEKEAAVFYMALGMFGVASATGLNSAVGNVISSAWNKLFPNPSGPVVQLMKELFSEVVLKSASPALGGVGRVMDEELVAFGRLLLEQANSRPRVVYHR